MTVLKNIKIAVLTLLFFLIPLNASQNNFLLDSDSYIIDKRLLPKINSIGDEVKLKTNVNIYIYVKSSYGISKELPLKQKFEIIKQKEKELTKNLNKPYAVLVLSLEDTHSNLLMSDDLIDVINKNEILDDYVIPVLASKDKNQLYAKASAAILNGYDEIADQVAAANGIEVLTNGIPDSGKTAGTIWKVFMYTLVVIGIVLYTFIVLKTKKRK